jgi:NAD(P)-dependent dehydrogenase (short-subunit alcohol dehydrogenase family)
LGLVYKIKKINMSNKYISEQTNQFKNKIIIVTGSTQGSGAETAKLLANRGAKGITICGRNSDKGNKVKSEIESIGCRVLICSSRFRETYRL